MISLWRITTTKGTVVLPAPSEAHALALFRRIWQEEPLKVEEWRRPA